ncbi:Winged helix-turn-helix transcription repressor DNA-binding [Penicillium chermesinum]|nr:Winged helix-turn-helix transcription repressor DNA-binding [Penicillium chermesinum]
MSSFSYAQAIKGSAAAAVPTKPATLENEKAELPVEEPSSTIPTESVAATATEAPQDTEKVTPPESKSSEFTTVTSKHTARSKAAHSRTSSPNVRSGNQSKEVASSNSPNGTHENATDKHAQSDAKTEKSDNGAENPKEKSGKDEKPEPPKELKAAPLPSVNIWQQRKEAQQAKSKATPTTATKAASGKSEDNQQENAKPKKKGDNDSCHRRGEEEGPGKTDKTEKQEKPQIRSHGKEKWIPVEHVPTAVFNTPLPTPGNRTGRKPARGGREGGRSAAHANGAPAEKSASGQSPHNQGPKQNPGERGRNDHGSHRAASLPAQARSSAGSDVTAPEGRKGQANERKGTRGPEETAPATNGKQVNGGENFARPQREGKQFPKSNDARINKAAQLGLDAQAAARANDRRFESGSKSADANREHFQEFARERGDSRSGRPGRGRGGAYSSFGGQNAQFGHPSNNSFVPNKSYGYQDRQRSQHAYMNGSQHGNRLPMRSPSLPASGNQYDVYQMPTNMTAMYNNYQPINGPMNAVPYQPYVEPYSVVHLLSTQLDYYFSVDNMCKDIYLRKQMDGQGFVPLGLFATFSRIRSLTEDFELLRHVSRHLRNAEYVIGEDSVDRLRPREWAQWVLPEDQRDPAPLKNGPAPSRISAKNENAAPNNHSESSVNGSMHPGSQIFIPNGVPSRAPRTPLSSAAPEFQPSGPPPAAATEILHVGHPQAFYPQFCASKGPRYQIPKSFIDNVIPASGLAPRRLRTPLCSTCGIANPHVKYVLPLSPQAPQAPWM